LTAGLLVALVGGYGAVMAVGCSLQQNFIYPQGVEEPVDRRVPPGAELIWVDTEDGNRVEGWFFAGAGRTADSPGPAVIFFHGNSELIDHCLEYAEMYPPWGVSVLLVEYRGYGRSGGEPSQEAIGRDMDAFYAWLIERAEVDIESVVYHGRSLGGGIAADLASRHPPRALILVSTFTSMGDMFWRYWVPGFIARDRYEVLDVVKGFDGPVLVIHGTRDNIIPVSHGRRLAEAARDATFVEIDANHDLPPDWGEHEATIQRFLESHGVPEGTE
jgi:fermentation-respiration switch protein FrsA (DUF1100 family)